MPSGWSEEGFAKQVIPGVDTSWVMGATDCPVGIAEDRNRLVEYVVRDVAATNPFGLVESSDATKVDSLLVTSEMVRTVVLVNRPRANQPEVRSRDEARISVTDLVLGHYRKTANLVECAEQDLHRRFVAGVYVFQ